jgi:thermostable 8-oxoguanine DNA glycosylase
MLLAKEIDGYGYALSCDFLKEVGYNAYGKPDVHLLDIFADGRIIAEKNEFECFKAMVKMAREVGEPASVVDKVFWIIGSGKFNEYNRKNAKKIPVKRLKDDFAKQYGQKASPASA